MIQKKIILFLFMLLFTITVGMAQKSKDFEVKSPDGNITLRVSTKEKLQWAVWHKGERGWKDRSGKSGRGGLNLSGLF